MNVVETKLQLLLIISATTRAIVFIVAVLCFVYIQIEKKNRFFERCLEDYKIYECELKWSRG